MLSAARNLVIAMLVVGSSDASATQCAGTHPESELVAPLPSALPPDGGAVVGTVSKPGLARPGAKPVAPTVQVDGRAAVATVLAPGLVVYRARGPAKQLTVRGSSRARATFTGAYGTPLAPPRVTAVVDAEHLAAVGTTTTITFASAVPRGAIAVVVHDRKHRARTWAPVTPGATTVTVYDDRLCRSIPAGMMEPYPGEPVTVVWIDEAGRPSASSNSVTVTR